MKVANKTNRSKRRGMALAMVMLLMVILFTIGTGLLGLSRNSQVLAIRTCSDIIARSAADAAMEKAIFEMNQKLEVTPWDDSTLPQATNQTLTNCDAVFSYTVTENGDLYFIEAIGNLHHAQRRTNSVLRLKGLFDNGILVVDKIEMENNNVIDAYNSTTGSTDENVQIGTISTESARIVFDNSTINGDVFVGVDGDVETVIQNGGGTINGQIYPLTEEPSLPVVTAPALPDMGVIDVQNNNTVTLRPDDSGKYTDITLGNSAVLEIDNGDVVIHVTGDVAMSNNSQIQIREDSSLTLYIDGNITGLNNAAINNEAHIPANFKMFLIGQNEQTIEFKNNADIYGAIYAPNADIVFENNTNFHGSITADSITMKNNADFYYDTALQDGKVDDQHVQFVIKHWQE